MINKDNKIKASNDISAADSISEYIEYHNLTLSDLSKSLHVNQSFLSDFLAKKRFLDMDFAKKLEEATGLKADLLLRMDEDYQKEKGRN